MKKKYLI